MEENKTPQQSIPNGVLDALSANIAILDAAGTILTVNDRWRQFGEANGLTFPRSAVGTNYMDICRNATGDWSEEGGAVASGLQAVADGTLGEFVCEYPCHGPHDKRWFICRATRFIENDQIRIVVAHENITERKTAEEKVYQSETLMRQTQHIAHVGGWEYIPGEDRVTWTDETYRIHDLEPGNPIDLRTAVSYYHPEDRPAIEAAVANTIETGKPFDMELRLITARGRPLRVRAVGEALLESGHTIKLFGMFQDVTEMRATEERLRQTEKMEAIGQLAGGIAHDFNNQLAGIIGYADLLRTTLESQPTLQRYADMVLQGARRSADLNRQLLAFSRKESGDTVPFDIHDMIEEVVSILAHTIDRRIEIERQFKARVSVTAGNPSQMQNALLNIALNARDAMPDGGTLTFTTEVLDLKSEAAGREFPDLTPGVYLCIGVSDTGCGMPAEVRQHIFEPFFTTKREGEGTGMGLATVYTAVKTHHGAIRVESSPGQGTTFSLYLPLTETETRAERPSSSDGIIPAGSGTVLIIDDEELVRELAQDILETLGYEVLLACDGVEGAALFERKKERIDLVVMDMMMPKMSGLQTMRALKEIDAQVRVLLSSGYSPQGEAQAILNEGAIGFVQKPFQIENLAKAVAAALRAPQETH